MVTFRNGLHFTPSVLFGERAKRARHYQGVQIRAGAVYIYINISHFIDTERYRESVTVY